MLLICYLYVCLVVVNCGLNAATQNMASKTRSHFADRTDGIENKKSLSAAPAFKKRHKGCSFCILDLENTPIPEFPPNEVVVGVISMEDVIEELLQVTVKHIHQFLIVGCWHIL